MRRLKPKLKERRRVLIPDELRSALVGALDIIRQADRDPDVTLNYDDAIQVENVLSGGKIGDDRRPYVFTYYPEEDGNQGQWSLRLHPTEIRDVADGVMAEITMFCCVSPHCRRKFRDESESCFDCDYVPEPDYAHLTMPNARERLAAIGVSLPAHASRDEVLAALGPPLEQGDGVDSPIRIRPWILYLLPTCRIQFAFGRRGQVTDVTFLPKDRRADA